MIELSFSKRFVATLIATLSFSCCQNPQAPVYSGDLSTRGSIPHFILVGDTQRTSLLEFWREQNDEARRAVLNKIAQEDPAFLVILGDLVFQGDDERHWRWFDGYTYAMREKQIPVFPLPGNHEYFGNHSKAFKSYFERFPHLTERLWNTFRFRTAAVILLNSNIGKLNEQELQEQDEWYQSKLKEYQGDQSIKTVIVCCHHPPFTNSTVVKDDKDVAQVREHFLEPFRNTPKAKLFFTGHCHCYEHFIEGGKHFIVSGGGGGPRQKLIVDPEKRSYEDTYKGGEYREFHFCKVVFQEDNLLVQMVKIDEALKIWSVGDEFVVN
ncbi:MAG TPA: metallophosphoesterase [Blastocatellia bacterium]